MVALEDIQRFFRGNISLNEPLARFTTFRIGGPADYYLEPRDKEDLLQIVRYFHQQGFPYVIIGNGSNVLIRDEGYRGAAIHLDQGFADISVEDDNVVAGAGVMLSRFVDFCIQRGLRGVEMLAGIPGTLGGAIIMNAGAYGGDISSFITEVEIIREGSFKKVRKEEAGFAYRRSGLNRDIILSTSFKLPRGDEEELKNIRKELLKRRNESQPVDLPNAGCIFKNPPGDYARRLIQECGLKGLRVGGAEVSEKHANFITNQGNATANDVLVLIKVIRQRVYTQFNVKLDLEVKLIGFDSSKEEIPYEQTARTI
jgi:UDP-N-acetylmuramate dehydrogenase